jgi:hypothetical protein
VRLGTWLLNALGISPTVRLIVSGAKIISQKGSLEGTLNFRLLGTICG